MAKAASEKSYFAFCFHGIGKSSSKGIVASSKHLSISFTKFQGLSFFEPVATDPNDFEFFVVTFFVLCDISVLLHSDDACVSIGVFRKRMPYYFLTLS